MIDRDLLELLGTLGLVSPYPLNLSLLFSTPLSSKYSMTLKDLSIDNAKLALSGPISSVCPCISIFSSLLTKSQSANPSKTIFDDSFNLDELDSKRISFIVYVSPFSMVLTSIFFP